LVAIATVLVGSSTFVHGFGESFKTKILQSVVQIRGVTYLLDDGCPLPDCDDSERSCFAQQIEMRKKFNGCSIGPHGDYMGCITEYLGPSRDEYVIPKFAKYCSALCYYRETPEKMNDIHDCPFNGTRVDAADRFIQTTTPIPIAPSTTVNLLEFFNRFTPRTTERSRFRDPPRRGPPPLPPIFTTPRPTTTVAAPSDSFDSQRIESNQAITNDVTSLFDVLAEGDNDYQELVPPAF